MKRKGGYALWLSAVAALYLFENNTATRILLLSSIVLPLVSVFFAFISARRLNVFLDAPQTCEKNAPFSITVRWKDLLPLGRVHCSVTCHNTLTGETSTSEQTIERKKAVFEGNAAHCGMLILTASCAVEDAFGLYRASAGKKTAALFLPPDELPLQIRLNEAAENGEEAAHPLPYAQPGADAGAREYVPGDPVRWMHWKLSGKMDTLMLREKEDGGLCPVRLIFSASASSYAPQAMDRLSALFFSASRFLFQAGRQHELLWSGEEEMLFSVDTVEDWIRARDAFFSHPPRGGSDALVRALAALPGGRSVVFGDPLEEGRTAIGPDHGLIIDG